MMIFRKGELVEVTGSLDDSVKEFVGRIGRVYDVEDLEKSDTPFVISFYADSARELQLFSHKELRLANGSEDAQKRQRYSNEARLYRMQRKV